MAWWHARGRDGSVVLRLDDLDGPRVDPKFIDQALFDLEWLGLDWDGPPFLSSSRLADFQEALDRLLEAGLAYPCVCSRGEIRTAQSAPQAGDHEPRYPGTCRGRFGSVREARKGTGRDAGIRFAVAPGPIAIDDGFAGRHEFDVAEAVGDFLIGRRDGSPAYQLSVVLDDAAQGVNEVVRGDDLLASAARQMLLQRALSLPTPRYFHVPLVVDDTGRRLAKRHNDLGLSQLRQLGVDPRTIVQWAANSAGMHCPEPLGAGEATGLFSMDRVPRGPAAAPSVRALMLTKTS